MENKYDNLGTKMENKYDNSGSLNKNTYKTKDGQPDYRGKAMVAGVRYQLGAWLKTTENTANLWRSKHHYT